MNKIVVYTGSFCPVTNAHYMCLVRAMKEVGSSTGIFLPTCDENIKKKMVGKMERLSLNGDVRVKMLKCYKNDNNNIDVSDYEIKIHDSDSTYKTFKYLRSLYKDSELYYVMGADKLHNIPHWKNTEEFLREFKFIVFDRSDINSDEVISRRPLLNKYRDNIKICSPLENLSNVSSTKIREMFLNGNNEYKKYLHPGVVDILEHLDLNDYPEVSVYDYINLKLKLGPHGVTAAFKKVFMLNVEYFNKLNKRNLYKNIEFINNNIKVEGEKKYNTSIIYEDKDYNEINDKYKDSLFIVEASKNRTGGMYDQGGSDTLEEELCRVSTLSIPLYTFGMSNLKWVKLSGVNTSNKYPLNNNVYIDGLKFIRYGVTNLYKELPQMSSEFKAIIVPSLNLTKNDKINDLNYSSVDGSLTSEGIDIMVDRLANAFIYAINNGHTSIVINAFGTGFHITPSDSALIISKVINKFKGYFERIIIVGINKGKMKKEFYPILTKELR